HDSWPKTFHHHIGISRQPVENRLAGRVFEINRDTLLITIDKLERCPAGRMRRLLCICYRLRRRRCVRSWSFNFQHFGAHIGQHHRTKSAGRYTDQLKNFDPLQWAWHSSSSLPQNTCASLAVWMSSLASECNTAPRVEQRQAYHGSVA